MSANLITFGSLISACERAILSLHRTKLELLIVKDIQSIRVARHSHLSSGQQKWQYALQLQDQLVRSHLNRQVLQLGEVCAFFLEQCMLKEKLADVRDCAS